jgi:molybdate transport system substrate-binding protein
MILPMQFSSLPRFFQNLFSLVSLSKFSVVLSSFITVAFAQSAPQLTVAAASDLIDVQGSLTQAFAAKSGVRLRFTFGASGGLARQIASGAPYDVFLSADEAQIHELAAAGDLLPDSVVVYARGRIALWSKRGSIGSLASLLAPQILHVAIANPGHAPYGLAAKQALEKAGLWTKLEKKIVYGESVRQALEYAESGNAEAAITAWSLVVHRGGILLPADLHSPIRQAGGVVSSSKDPQSARAFLRFLMSPEGRRVLENGGFGK